MSSVADLPRMTRCMWASQLGPTKKIRKSAQWHMLVQTPLRQFKGIPAEMLARLEKKDLPWERYYDLSAQELGELTRFPKLGKQLHRYVHLLPRLELAAAIQPITRTVLKVRACCAHTESGGDLPICTMQRAGDVRLPSSPLPGPCSRCVPG